MMYNDDRQKSHFFFTPRHYLLSDVLLSHCGVLNTEYPGPLVRDHLHGNLFHQPPPAPIMIISHWHLLTAVNHLGVPISLTLMMSWLALNCPTSAPTFPTSMSSCTSLLGIQPSTMSSAILIA